MQDFLPLSFEAKPIYDAYTGGRYTNMEHSFPVMYVWQEDMRIHYSVMEGALVLLACNSGSAPFFIQPLYGAADTPLLPLVEQLIEIAEKKGFRFALRGVEDWYAKRLSEEAPGRFSVFDDVDYFEYVYNTSDLIELAGKKFSQKRNHINAFLRDHTYKYIPYDDSMLETVMELDRRWEEEREFSADYEHESIAIRRALSERARLGVRACIIEVDGIPSAFSVGVPTGNMFTVLFEKARPNIPGLYQIVNREFARHEAAGFPYINRQEDIGIPGLRQSKRSYNPAFMVEKKGVDLI